MVRINLAKKSISKKERRRFRFPLRLIIISATVAAGAVSVTLGIRYLPKSKPQKTEVPTTAVPTPTTLPFTPSTYKKTDIVEDVVREVAQERTVKAGKAALDLPYSDMSLLEKVNYEALFAKKVFELLSRAMPDGIGLRTLEVDNFETVYAVGIGATRESVSSAFIALKKENVELMPRPLSYITSNDGEGYRFVVMCKTKFGLDLSDPFQASDHLATRDELSSLLKKIADIGEAAGMRWHEKPVRLSAEKVGVYKRFLYKCRSKTAYSNFVKFLLDIYSGRIPCGFKKVDMKAISESAVDIGMEILITVKE